MNTKTKPLNYLLKFLYLFIVPFLIFIISSLLIRSSSSLIIFPAKNVRYSAFCDSSEKGNSSIDLFSSEDSIKFEFTLREGFRIPYAGIQSSMDNFIDLSGYSKIKIRMKASKSRKVRVILINYLRGFTQTSNLMSNLYLIKELSVTDEMTDYTLNLSDFHAEKWWYELNNLAPFDPKIKPDLKSISAINIENDENMRMNLQERLNIEHISFSGSSYKEIVIPLIIVAFYFIVWVAIRKRVIKPVNNKISEYKKVNIGNSKENSLKALMPVLQENYTDPELTVEKTASLSGVNIEKIPKILKTNYNMSFPQYLNAIRITEAKRLLAETDVKIIEISFAVGFGNLSHFNRCFKTSEKISPKDYRKKYRKN